MANKEIKSEKLENQADIDIEELREETAQAGRDLMALGKIRKAAGDDFTKEQEKEFEDMQEKHRNLKKRLAEKTGREKKKENTEEAPESHEAEAESTEESQAGPVEGEGVDLRKMNINSEGGNIYLTINNIVNSSEVKIAQKATKALKENTEKKEESLRELREEPDTETEKEVKAVEDESENAETKIEKVKKETEIEYEELLKSWHYGWDENAETETKKPISDKKFGENDEIPLVPKGSPGGAQKSTTDKKEKTDDKIPDKSESVKNTGREKEISYLEKSIRDIEDELKVKDNPVARAHLSVQRRRLEELQGKITQEPKAKKGIDVLPETKKTARETLMNKGLYIDAEDIKFDLEYKFDEKTGELVIYLEDNKNLKDIDDLLKDSHLEQETKEALLMKVTESMNNALDAEATNEYSKFFKHHKTVLLGGALVSAVAGGVSAGARMLGGGLAMQAGKVAGGTILGGFSGAVSGKVREWLNPTIKRMQEKNSRKLKKIRQKIAKKFLTEDNLKIAFAQVVREQALEKIREGVKKTEKGQDIKNNIRDYIDANQSMFGDVDNGERDKLAGMLAHIVSIEDENSRLLAGEIDKRLGRDKDGKPRSQVKRGTVMGSIVGTATGAAQAFLDNPYMPTIASGAIGGVMIGNTYDQGWKKWDRRRYGEQMAAQVEEIAGKEKKEQEDINMLKSYLESGILDEHPTSRENAKNILIGEFLRNTTEANEAGVKEINDKWKEKYRHKKWKRIVAYSGGVITGIGSGIAGRFVFENFKGYFGFKSDSGKSGSNTVGKIDQDKMDQMNAMWPKDERYGQGHMPEGKQATMDASMNRHHETGPKYPNNAEPMEKEGVAGQGKTVTPEYPHNAEPMEKEGVASQHEARAQGYPYNAEPMEKEGVAGQGKTVTPEYPHNAEPMEKEGVVSDEAVRPEAKPIEIKIEGKVNTYSEAAYEAVKKADAGTQDNYIRRWLGEGTKVNDDNRAELVRQATRKLSIANIKMGDGNDVKNLVYKGNVGRLYPDGRFEMDTGESHYAPSAVSEEHLRTNAANIRHHLEEGQKVIDQHLNAEAKAEAELYQKVIDHSPVTGKPMLTPEQIERAGLDMHHPGDVKMIERWKGLIDHEFAAKAKFGDSYHMYQYTPRDIRILHELSAHHDYDLNSEQVIDTYKSMPEGLKGRVLLGGIMADKFDQEPLGYMKVWASGYDKSDIATGMKMMLNLDYTPAEGDITIDQRDIITLKNAFGYKGIGVMISRDKIGIDGPLRNNWNTSDWGGDLKPAGDLNKGTLESAGIRVKEIGEYLSIKPHTPETTASVGEKLATSPTGPQIAQKGQTVGGSFVDEEPKRMGGQFTEEK